MFNESCRKITGDEIRLFWTVFGNNNSHTEETANGKFLVDFLAFKFRRKMRKLNFFVDNINEHPNLVILKTETFKQSFC